MVRVFRNDRLVIASHNPGKVREIAHLLGTFVPQVDSAADHGLAEPEETGDSFVANAALKAHHTAAGTGLPALADDSGLVVPALDGAPGLHSARWAVRPEGRRDFGWAMERLTAALDDRPNADRRAYFVCALALAWPDGPCETVEGRAYGCLVWPPRGDRGFGYDPIFVPDGHDVTYGEMEPAAKHAISHRADAFRQLVARCFRR
ncbi:MAG: RdgB/HAM1 family non-canonical purine NTP pyrophosphatase [Alphaproteobacteria bacterium]|jgi:XTP/dITP diphosphohydrolase|nr:RdgB/HAM1 family non-canonical purine NTP pyrophosphatase [Alphaproteobacteria bacterium]